MVVFCGKICGKIETLLDWNKNWCRYVVDMDPVIITKRQNDKNTKRQK